MAENTTDKEALKAQKEAEKAAEKAKKERIKASKPKKEGSVLSRAGGKVKKYWKDFTGTCKKIVWPTGKQVLKNSGVTLVAIIIIGIIVALFDFGLQNLFKFAEQGVTELGSAGISQEVEEDADAEETQAEGETEETTEGEAGETEEATEAADAAGETSEEATEAE